MNIVLDTNVLVAAFRSQTGASFRVLELAFTTELFQPQFSIPVLSEYESKLLERTNASSETVDNFLNSLLRRGKHHVIYFLFRGFLKDKNDSHGRNSFLVPVNNQQEHLAHKNLESDRLRLGLSSPRMLGCFTLAFSAVA